MEKNDYSILILDDEVEITKTIARQFRRKYNVFTATNADDAFQILDKNEIKVVVSDQRMPGLTGVDFFSIIKDQYPDTLRLILTGYSDIDAIVGAINNGQIFRYITKPWNPDEFESVIKEAFEKHELIRTNKRLMSNLQTANVRLEEIVKKRTEELEKANRILTDLNIEKNKYVGIVAHELRNPIGIAHSFSNLILEEHEQIPKNKQRTFLGIINNRCSYALNLMSDILDISKIEAGVIDINPKTYDYIDLLKQIILQNEVFAEQKSQLLQLTTKHNNAIFTFDRDKIEQVVSNLISNAMKYSEKNTTIEIVVEKTDSHIVTSVVDKGQGITKSELEGIFKPYKTTSTKGTQNEKSTGLGLAITKKIVEIHNGTIDVSSVVNKGSTFVFKLPL